MKQSFLILSLLTIVLGFSRCSDCKKCHAEFGGIKSPEQEYCGDELKKIKQSPGMVCE